MSEDYKVQVSLSAPPPAQYAKGAMANFRGDTVDEVASLLEEAKTAGLLELASEVESVWTAAAGLGARTVEAKPAQNNVAQPQAGNVKTCAHGVMRGPQQGVARSGQNAGKPYLRWDCPVTGQGKCKSVFENPA